MWSDSFCVTERISVEIVQPLNLQIFLAGIIMGIFVHVTREKSVFVSKYYVWLWFYSHKWTILINYSIRLAYIKTITMYTRNSEFVLILKDCVMHNFLVQFDFHFISTTVTKECRSNSSSSSSRKLNDIFCINLNYASAATEKCTNSYQETVCADNGIHFHFSPLYGGYCRRTQ